MSKTDDLLQTIDSKLAALLALIVDARLREAGGARPRERSVDQLLSDAGLPASAIAGLLGKTERAVHLQLQRGRQGKAARSTGRRRTEGGGK